MPQGDALFRRVPPWVRARYRLLRALRRLHLRCCFHPDYRPPVAGLETISGFEPRRAEMVLTWLLDVGLLDPSEVIEPGRASVATLLRTHTPEHIDAMSSPTELARVFAIDEREVPVDELLHTLRLAVGGTMTAAAEALRTGGAVLNLLGGFHHAGPSAAGGLSVFNDIAVAIADLRANGLQDRVVVLDLDAHPPDGTAACLAEDPQTWIGSISGVHWQLPAAVDETVLPAGSQGPVYLAALHALLARMPAPRLAFVVAGGDVLRGDRMGALGLQLEDAAARDVMVAERLRGVPAVWLPGGGYHADAWRLLATTASILALGRPVPPRRHYDPVRARMARIGSRLQLEADGDPDKWFDASDVDAMWGGRSVRAEARLLGYYTASMIELALHHYGILDVIRRLGYSDPRVVIDRHPPGDRFQLRARSGASEHVLVEAVLGRARVGERQVLYVHWLALRHPRAAFHDRRRALPGQDVPGLGLAKEAGELMAQLARRLRLEGVAFEPATLHVAYAARRDFRFVDVDHQADWLALQRDLGDLGVARLTALADAGALTRNGEAWRWPAGRMVCWLERAPDADAAVAMAAASVRFAVGDEARSRAGADQTSASSSKPG